MNTVNFFSRAYCQWARLVAVSVTTSYFSCRRGLRPTAAILIVLATLLNGCTHLFFYPQKQLVRQPDDLGLAYEEIIVTTQDKVELHSWLLKADQPKAVVFFLHGNAENISTHIGSVYWLPPLGYDVFLLDYRGFGRSKGSPAIPEVFLDVAAGYQWVQQYAQERDLPIYVLGQSLGAAISVYYFAQADALPIRPDRMALDAVFSSHREIAREALKGHWLTWPLQGIAHWFLPKDYAPVDYAAKLHPMPLLFFHSPTDQVVPFHQGREVFAAAKEPKAWVEARGGHIMTFMYPDLQQRLLEFFE